MASTGDSRLAENEWADLMRLTALAMMDLGDPDHEVYQAFNLVYAFSNCVLKRAGATPPVIQDPMSN